MLILGGVPALSFRCDDDEEEVSIAVCASGFLFVVKDSAEDLRSTLTKLDEVTVTLGNRGIILAGLSFDVDTVEDVGVVEVADEVADDAGVGKAFSMVSPEEIGRSGSGLPAPTLPNPGWPWFEASPGFPSRALRSNFDLSTVTVSDVVVVNDEDDDDDVGAFDEVDLWFNPASVSPRIRSLLMETGGTFLATSTLLSTGSTLTEIFSELSLLASPPSFLSSLGKRLEDGDGLTSLAPTRLCALESVVSAPLLLTDLRSRSFDVFWPT